MPEDRATEEENEKEAQAAVASTVGPTHVEQTLAPRTPPVETHSDVGSGNDVGPGIQGDSAQGARSGSGLPACDGGSGVPDVGSGDDGDNWKDEVPEWEVVGAHLGGEVLEPGKAVDDTSRVTRAQADRIVTLIGQGWDPDTIFERVGVAIIPD